MATGCAPDGDPPGPAADSPTASPAAAPDLTATAELRRTVQEPRSVAIAVTNHGADPVRVVRAELVGDSFAPTGPFEVDVPVPPGLVRDVFLRHGDGRCDGRTAPAAAPARAVLEVETIDGRRHPVALDLPHPNGSLDRRLGEDCVAQVLGRTLAVELELRSPLPDGRLPATLRLERVGGDEPVALHEVAGTVLFSVRPEQAGEPLGRIPAGGEQLELPVTVDAARCSGHAVGEAKQRHTVHLWVTVGGGERLHTTVEPDADQRERLDAMHDRRCAS